MDNVSITHDTITEFLTRIIHHSYGIFTVDPSGYIMSNNEYIMFQDQSKSAESNKFVVYQSNIKDSSAYVLNPFSESLTLGVERAWFYDLLLSYTECALPIIKLMKTLLHFGYCSSLELTSEEQDIEAKKVEKKKKTKVKELETSPLSVFPFTDVQKIELASFLSDISETLVSDIIHQFDLITADPNAFFKIIYQDTSKKAYVSSLMFNATERANFRAIKPKTWHIYQTLFKKIFNIDDIDGLSVTSSSISYPRFESVFTLFNIVQKQLSKFLYVILTDEQDQNQFLDNVQFFTEALKYLDIFKRLGGWLKCVPVSPTKVVQPYLTKMAAPLTFSPSYQKPYAIPKPITPTYNYNYNPQGLKLLSNNMVAPMPKLL
jgi:hypothetical protein